MSTRRQLSWRARQGGERLRQESRKAAVSCCQDFLTLRLVPLKITFFVIMGATQCVDPFIPLLLRALGLTLEETGLVFAISPLIPIFAPLLAGLVADKIGNFRCILVFTVALSGVVSLVNIAIPPARTTLKHSPNISFSLTCEEGSFVLTPVPPASDGDECEFLDETLTVLSLEAKNCGYTCPDPAVVLPTKVMKDMKKMKVLQAVNSTLYHVCKVQGGVEDGGTQQKCFRKNLNKTRKAENMPRSFQIHNLILPLSGVTQIGGEISVLNYTMSKEAITSFECIKGVVPKKITIPKISLEETPRFEKDKASVSCHFHCLAQLPHKEACVKRPLSMEHNVALSFWFFVTINTLGKLLIGLSYTLFEVAVLAILKEYGFDYGLQRIYGSIGGMVFAPLSGLAIDYLGKGGRYTDYHIMFMLYCALKLFCALILVMVDLRFKVPATNLCHSVCCLFRNIEVILLLFVVFISGMCYGFIENFLPLHLRDLGATNWFIGILTTIASFSALPFLALSGGICKKFGYFQSIAFGLLCYSIRCVGYSAIKVYYWAAPFELLEGITTGLLVTSAIVYGKLLSSKTNMATLQGIMATLHYGLGKSAGSFLGGFLMAKLKAPLAFQIFSGIAIVAAFCYYLVGKLYIVPRQNKRLLQKLEVMKMPVETISRKEHRRSSRSQDLSNAGVSTLQRHGYKKRAAPKIKESQEREEEPPPLDETQMTQMTDLPNDTIASLNETVQEEEAKEKTEKTEDSAK
ncbi:hypothetical protein O3P69_000013 [Scylla paramamosain]|uniref:Major facilitator superfamily associated domain-containing protein n=2 Tax=Scylla paramamosain TaxID=85552 RepID=A0AAW0UVR3_SCYPA